MTGAQYTYEAGPKAPNGSSDWRDPNALLKSAEHPGGKNKPNVGAKAVRSGPAACGKDHSGNAIPGFDQRVVQGPHACFKYQTRRINNAKIKYSYWWNNSNAFVATILTNCNIKPTNPSLRVAPAAGHVLIPRSPAPKAGTVGGRPPATVQQ